MKKNMLSIFFALCTVLALMSYSAFAEEAEVTSAEIEPETTEEESAELGTPPLSHETPNAEESPSEVQLYAEKVAWPVEGGNIYFDPSLGAITGCDKNVTLADIPDQINGVQVITIGKNAFSGRSSLINVTIPNGVTSIGDWAFHSCSSLTGITIPNSVTSIGDWSFDGCASLTDITIPNSVISIGKYAFGACVGLISVDLSDNVTSIGDSMFIFCSRLTSVTIPSSVTNIGANAFAECSSLSNIDISDSVTSIGERAFLDCSSLTNISMPDSVIDIGEYAFQNCTSLTHATLSNHLSGIPNGMFSNCQMLTDIFIPDSVTNIGKGAFSSCGLTDITIPGNVKSIEDSAFSSCRSLTSVIISDGVASIGKDAFNSCKSLSTVTIPGSITSVGSMAFAYSGSFDATILDGATDIVDSAFCYSGITSIDMPNTVTNIGKNAFYDCRELTNITIPNSVVNIGNSAFHGCSGLTSITLPATAIVEQYAFIGCTAVSFVKLTGAGEMSVYSSKPWGNNTTTIDIEHGVTSIAQQAFYGCCGLTNVTIPNSIVNIGDSAFKECSGLTNVTIPNSIVSIGDSAFEGCSGLANMTIPNSVIDIGASAFYGCSGLTSVTIPATVAIGIGAFGNCTKVSYVRLTGVGEMGTYSSKPWGSNTTTIDIAAGVTSIGDSAFSGCSGLTGITIPGSVTSIGNSTFEGCSGLTSITIPSSVTSIGSSAFSGCSGLTGITIPDEVTSIENCTFEGCSGLPDVTIPDGITRIGSSAFSNCTGLISVTIPASVLNIGNYAFDGCTSLTDIYYASTKEQWQSITIGSGNAPLTSSNSLTTIHYNNNVGTINPSSDIQFTFLGDAVYIGQNACLTATIPDSDFRTEEITWTSSDPAIATVARSSAYSYQSIYNKATATSANAVIQGIKPGMTIINVSTPDGRSASYRIAIRTAPNASQLSGIRSLLVGESETLTAKITLNTVIAGGSSEWTSSNSNVVAFDMAGTGHVTHSELPITGDAPPLQATDSVRIYGLSRGEATVTYRSNDTESTFKVRVYSEEDKILEQLAMDWNTAYETYITSVRNTLEEKSETISDVSIQDQAQVLKQADDGKMVSFLADYGGNEEIVNSVYQAVVRFLAENTAQEINLSNINVSGADAASISAGIVNNITRTFDVRSYSYKVGGATILIEGFSGAGTYLRDITYQKGSKSQLVAYIVSTQSQVKQIINAYVRELMTLEKNLISEACSQVVKSVIGTSINQLAKNKISSTLSKHTKAFEQTGVGKVATAVESCIDYYEYVQRITSLANSNPLELASSLASMKSLSFAPESIRDKAVKMAMQGIENAGEAFEDAVEEYIETGKIDVGSTGKKWMKQTGSGIYNIIKCPVNVSIYDSSGKQVGYVGEDDFWYDESIVYIERYGDAKRIYSSGDTLTFQMVGTDYGTLSCTFEEYSNGIPTGRVNYYDIPLYNGKIVSAVVPSEIVTEQNISLVEDGISVSASESLLNFDYHTATVSIACVIETSVGGEVYGTGEYVRGDAVTLQAIPESGYTFLGWQNSAEALLSVSPVYEFTALEDMVLTAQFAPQQNTLTNYLVPVTEMYAGQYGVEIVQTGNRVTVSLANFVGNTEDIPSVFLAKYTEEGQMTSIEILSGTILENGVVIYEGTVPDSFCKLMILNGELQPIAIAVANE